MRKKKEESFGSSDFDKKLVYSLSKSKIPNLKQIKHIGKVLTKKELWIVRFFVFLIFANLIFVGTFFVKNHLVTAPAKGGEYTEGLVGAPKHINPLYASISDVDSDISKLVFSALFKYDKNGNLRNDLVESYEISEDEKIYTLKIRDNVYWHHGEKLTVNDIIFTFNAIKSPAYESSLRLSFLGVQIEKKDEQSINFVLSEKFAGFAGLLTFGIMPQDIWSQIVPESASLAELNIKPIGSGPFRFKTLIKDKSGNIKAYNLERNDGYYGNKPYISKLVFKFFVSFAEAVRALNENVVDGISYLPRENKNDLIARDSLYFHKLELPQIKSIFFNQERNKNLADINVRKALAFAIPKEFLINSVLEGEAKPVYGPILENSFAYNNALNKYGYNKDEAEKILGESDWKKIEISEEEVDEIIWKEKMSTSTEDKITEAEENKKLIGAGKWMAKVDSDDEIEYLTISLTTINEEESRRATEAIKGYWEDIGVKVTLNIVPINQVQIDIIEPRDFDSLFFGQLVGNDPDSYVFWHSSQVGEGGLNLSNYANDDVDRMLEEARFTLNREERIEKYGKFQEILNNDVPAIFLYSSFYTYVQDKKINGFEVKNISSPHDRFNNIEEWYIKTGRKLVW